LANKKEHLLLPQTPTEKESSTAYKQMLRELQRLKNELNRLSDEGMVNTVNWAFYSFKEKISTIEESIQYTILRGRDLEINFPVVAFRLKDMMKGHSWSAANTTQRMQDYALQSDALDELRGDYLSVDFQFDGKQTRYLDHFLNIQFLYKQLEGLKKGKMEKIVLEFRPLCAYGGEKEVTFLSNLYLALAKELELNVVQNEKTFLLTIEGFNVRSLFQQELGIHLFYVAHQNPIPIQLAFPKETSPTPKILRQYDDLIIHDLRSGFSNARSITAKELKLMLWSGM
jgi:hypothetical protein